MSKLSGSQSAVTIAESLVSLSIAISHRPNKGRFTFELVLLAIHACIAIPVFSITIFAIAFQSLSTILASAVSAIGIGAVFLLIYRQFRESLEYIYDREVIEIDNQAIKIARSGAGFKDSREYPADNIKAITLLFPDNPRLNWLRALPWASANNIDSFVIYQFRGLRRTRTFGRGMDREEARQVLDAVWRRYPQYKG